MENIKQMDLKALDAAEVRKIQGGFTPIWLPPIILKIKKEVIIKESSDG